MRWTRRAVAAVAVGVLGLATAAAAETLVLPGAAHAAGAAGTAWVSDLRLFNPGQRATVATVRFTAYDGGAPVEASFELGPGELLAQDDVVLATFGLEAAGFLTVHSLEPLVGGLRTSNLTPAGSYGQYISGGDRAATEVWLTGLAGGAFRTNLGLVNPGQVAAHVVVGVGAGRELDLEAGAGTQLGRLEAWVGFDPAGDSGSVTARTPVACYASVVDNSTGDPTYLPGLAPVTEAVLAGVAHATGAAGTNWRTDLSLHALAAATVELTFVPFGTAGAGLAPQASVELASGETRVLTDVVATLAPGQNASGLVWLSADAEVVAAARTYNLTGAGTYGQSILPVAAGAEVAAGASALFLFAAKDPTGAAGFRSNLALVNPTGDEASYQVELLDGQGKALRSSSLTVPARSGVQQGDVVGWLGVQGLADGVVRVTGEAPFAGYLSSVDNRTGDASTVTPLVAAVNRPPVAADDQVFTPQDTAVTVDVLANDADPDGDPLSLSRVTVPPGHGSAAIAGSAVAYTPEAGWSGDDSLEYEVTDGRGGADRALVSLRVNPPGNRPPVAVDDVAATASETGVEVDVLANDADPDGDPLSLSRVTTAPAHGTAQLTGSGTVWYAPAPGFAGDDGFAYEIADGRGGWDQASVTVTVALPPLEVACGADPTSGVAPLEVQLAATVTGGLPPDVFDWDFGDGSAHASEQSPLHTYVAAGGYTAEVTVWDAEGKRARSGWGAGAGEEGAARAAAGSSSRARRVERCTVMEPGVKDLPSGRVA